MHARTNGPLLALLPFWLFALVFKFGSAFHYTVVPVLGERIMPVWMVGLFVGGVAFVQMLLDVPAGYALDRYGYVRVLRYATLVFLLAGAVLLSGITLATFALTLVLSTLGWLFFGPGVEAYVLVASPKAESGRYVALRDAFTSMGVVLAAILATWAIDASAPAIGAWVVALLGAAFVILLFVRRERTTDHAAEKKLPTQHYRIRRSFLRHTLRAVRRLNPASALLVAQNFTGAVFYGIIWFVIPLTIAEMAEGGGMLGLGLGVFDLSVVVLGALFGWLADRMNKRRLVVIGLLLFGLSGVALGFHLGALFFVLGFLATAGDELSSISLWAWMNVLDEDHAEDALVAGAVTCAEDLGWTIGPIMAGLLFTTLGPAWTIAIGGALVLGAWAVSLAMLGHPSARALHRAVRQEHRPPRRRHKA